MLVAITNLERVRRRVLERRRDGAEGRNGAGHERYDEARIQRFH